MMRGAVRRVEVYGWTEHSGRGPQTRTKQQAGKEAASTGDCGFRQHIEAHGDCTPSTVVWVVHRGV